MRGPARYCAEMGRRTDLAPDADIVLKLALGRRVEFVDAALNAADGDGLRNAAAAFVRQVYLRAEATPYQTLGIESDASSEVIKERFRQLMQLVHPDRHDARAQWPDACAAQVNRAYAILRNETTRAKYDGEQRAARNQQARAVASPSYPSPHWQSSGQRARKPPPAPVLPEWLTDRIGGYARRHPAVVAFFVLIVGATLVTVASFRDDRAELLAQEVRVTRSAVMAGASAAPETTPTPAAPVSTPSATARPPLVFAAPVGNVDGARMGAAVPADRGREGAAHPVAASAASAGLTDPIRSAPPLPPLVVTPALIGTQAAPGMPPALIGVQAAPEFPPPVVAGLAQSSAPMSAAPLPPTTAELDAFFNAFVEAYDQGRLDAFVALFDESAESNLYRGRAAIRGEYDELFRLSDSRRMQLTRINWRRDGDRTIAKGEVAVKIRWLGGSQVEQRVLVDMEVARRDGRLLITRLMHRPGSP